MFLQAILWQYFNFVRYSSGCRENKRKQSFNDLNVEIFMNSMRILTRHPTLERALIRLLRLSVHPAVLFRKNPSHSPFTEGKFNDHSDVRCQNILAAAHNRLRSKDNLTN